MSVYKTGWATKQGGMIKTWKKRYFVLTDDWLVYYDKPDGNEHGRIPLDPTVVVSPAPDCKKQPAYKIVTSGRTYYVVPETQAEVNEWVAVLTAAINNSKNKRIPKAGVPVQTSNSTTPAKKVSMDDFTILGVLGRGTYGKVQLVKEKETGKLFALKTMSKRLLAESDQVEQTITERNVLLTTKHPFLVCAHYTFQTDAKIFMVLDYVPGGELFGRLKEESLFAESRVRLYAAEICLGLGYLHKLGFIYRDLKPENILVDQDGHLKITDFGLAKNTDMGTTSTFCGTPEYIAPEMLQRLPYTKAVDWWSYGIIIYEMLTGLPPFYDENTNQMYRSILRDDVKYPSHVSHDARSLINQLLNRNPEARLGSGPSDYEEIKAHPFFASINWENVFNKKTKPEWKPKIKNATDTSLFDEEFTHETGGVSFEDGSLIGADTQEQFNGFTCTQDSTLDKL
ncbi:AGC family protein kinase [Trichomonas vaginalis G3]|uniref:non-specific serine/threonine protein kinase n=1 Tax=Trichomonas vaginalis (strain ATCC PRA-98 / G3) TaxID=412133 RepID=A2DS63_TRIV3|nr:ribosomal protein S6 kinase family [Trichomonas vaginalis G3]EAY16833.1 AGC family protein kinase [Trichomonas vaginalis G3]KAI5490755.1 ribosomal protein S6 kinase family [Trichomonas vaginalis G3]|eukprot:XP_001329056.1 AGC family protein kinase [Trichomonas vaginalis G3]